MKAIVCLKYGPPEVLQLKEVAKPTPGKNEVCIEMRATAVTSSDCIIRGFKVPIGFWLPMALAIGFRRPRKGILGMVFAGEVESIGKEVGSFKKGDQVFGFDRFGLGAYAEYKCISENGMLAMKPSNVPYAEAAAIPFGGLIALAYLRKGNIERGQKVLIYGASGAVGTSAVQLAKYFGAEVTGVCGTANVDLVRSLGSDRVLDYTRDDLAASRESYDFVFDAVGKRKSSKLKSQIAGTSKGEYISVDDGSPKLSLEDLSLLKELVEMGKLIPVIDKRYPLEDIVEAHRYVDQGHKKGNVIVTV